jgi:hypothetical protein
MSLQNVEMVRHVYEAGLIDRDPEELLKLATPEIEYVNPPYAVEPGVAAGSAPSIARASGWLAAATRSARIARRAMGSANAQPGAGDEHHTIPRRPTRERRRWRDSSPAPGS